MKLYYLIDLMWDYFGTGNARMHVTFFEWNFVKNFSGSIDPRITVDVNIDKGSNNIYLQMYLEIQIWEPIYKELEGQQTPHLEQLWPTLVTSMASQLLVTFGNP
ncbi:hypothetical protein ACJX0J_005664, partial [Zea mays]